MMPLEGRVALVTGVSRKAGIGFAIANRLASMGADLLIHSFAPYDTEQPWGDEPDDAARLIGWLVTDDAQWITGQVINSEGGFRRSV